MRASANPDPVEVEYLSPKWKRTYLLRAYRSGAFAVLLDGKQIFNTGPEVNRGFGSPKYPSNRLQAEALNSAKVHVELMGAGEG